MLNLVISLSVCISLSLSLSLSIMYFFNGLIGTRILHDGFTHCAQWFFIGVMTVNKCISVKQIITFN